MLTIIETNWPAFAAVLVVALLVAWLLWGRAKPARERHRAPDALDEGAAPAQRNQALIDAPSAAAQAALDATNAARLADSGAAAIMGGIGEVVAAGAAQEVAAAREAEALASGDDLSRIKGLGPKLKTRLAELGVTNFAQIAAWTDADVAAIDAQLGSFAGRPARDQWVAQAAFLASGDVAGYEAKFGKV